MYRKFSGFATMVLLAACTSHTESSTGNVEPVVKQEEAKARYTQGIFQPDAAAVAAAFSLLEETPSFKNEIEDDGASVYDPGLPALIGDINHDGLPDALKPFTIEGRGGGNNWTAHYAVFINKDNKLTFSNIFNRGGDWAERITTFNKIKDNVLCGVEVPNNNFPELDTIVVNYIYKDKDLIQISK